MSVVSHYTRQMFNGVNVVATTDYIYNDSAGNAATTGWFTSKSDFTNIQINLATLNASSLTYRIEGRNIYNGSNYIASIFCGSLNSNTSIDKLITLQSNEKFESVRMGVKVNNDASPNNVYIVINNTEIK